MSRAAPAMTAVVLAAALPPTLAVGLGWWNRPAAIEQALLLGAFSYLSELIEATPLPQYPVAAGVGLLLLIPVMIVLPRLEARLPAVARRLTGVVEGAVCALGILAALGVLAVGASIDRPVFWGGLLAWGALAVRRAGPEDPPPALRVASVTTAATIVLLAGVTLLEGPGLHSPAFRIGEAWLDGPGRHPVLVGGLWVAAGAVVWVAAGRTGGTGRRRRPERLRLALAVAGLLVAVGGTWIQAPAAHIAIASSLAALGAILGAGGLGRRLGWRLRLPSVATDLLDPRRVHAVLLPLVLWGALCAGRGMLVHMFTAPPELPPGVQRITQRTGIFSLGVDESGEAIYFTDRVRTEVGLIDLADASRSRTWSLHAAGADAVEELGGPVEGALWVSAGRWNPAPAMGLMSVDLETGPGEYRALSGCWIASWIPMPETAALRVREGRRGDVLLGCEGDAAVYVFRPSTGRTIARMALPDDVEGGVFSADGGSLYGISLWGEPSVSRYEFPSGRRLGTAPVGPFNWAVAIAGDGSLWVSRFFEGGALVFDPDTLRMTGRVPLSFGVRAMVHDPVRERIWASAAYSGKVWEVETTPPYRRRAFALCGQARDLQTDGRGRVVVATDCGIFRIDPEAAADPP